MPAPLIITPPLVEEGVRHLRRADRRLGAVIERVGPFTLKRRRGRFAVLVGSIISQQISTAAARSIRRRLEGATAPRPISPASIGALTDEELRAAGLSPQKVRYLRDLCDKVESGAVRLPRLSRLPDDEVIAELVGVTGIGRWTAQMFLMFCLGRPDVFPHDDLGIRSALKRIYQLGDLPDRDTSHRLAAPWKPYATIASWYCWRSGELPDR